jgi:DNA modification methylase
MPGQVGLESSPDEYAAKMVEIFREVKRALRDDGTLWLNLGDSYNSSPPGNSKPMSKSGLHGAQTSVTYRARLEETQQRQQEGRRLLPNLKPKDLIGIPWLVAFALRADGWYLRSDIIWNKPNPMPESVTDRPTKAHEYIFLLSKSARYFYDAEAIAEVGTGKDLGRPVSRLANNPSIAIRGGNQGASLGCGSETRNKRSVWTVTTVAFSDAHFATFPPALITPCILAGSLELGSVEPDDLILTPTGEGQREGDPSMMTGRAGFNRPRRNLESVRPMSRAEQAAYAEQLKDSTHKAEMATDAGGQTTFDHYTRTDRSGARPVPPHLLESWIGRGWLSEVSIPPRLVDRSRCTVLDPFTGSGTTGLVALRHNRNFIGVELNPEYVEMARRRITNDAPLFNEEVA